jgi:hypothetical protein
VKLSGGTTPPDQRRERKLIAAIATQPTTHHEPLQRLLDGICASHYSVMLDQWLELQEVVFIFRVILSLERLLASEGTNAALRVPMGHGQEMGYGVFVSPHHRNAEVAWNRPVVWNGPLLEEARIGITL